MITLIKKIKKQQRITHYPPASIGGHVTVHLHGPAAIAVEINGVRAAGGVSILLHLGTVRRVWVEEANWEKREQSWRRYLTPLGISYGQQYWKRNKESAQLHQQVAIGSLPHCSEAGAWMGSPEAARDAALGHSESRKRSPGL